MTNPSLTVPERHLLNRDALVLVRNGGVDYGFRPGNIRIDGDLENMDTVWEAHRPGEEIDLRVWLGGLAFCGDKPMSIDEIDYLADQVRNSAIYQAHRAMGEYGVAHG